MSNEIQLTRRPPYETTVYLLENLASTANSLASKILGATPDRRWIYDGEIETTLAQLSFALAALQEHHWNVMENHGDE